MLIRSRSDLLSTPISGDEQILVDCCRPLGTVCAGFNAGCGARAQKRIGTAGGMLLACAALSLQSLYLSGANGNRNTAAAKYNKFVANARCVRRDYVKPGRRPKTAAHSNQDVQCDVYQRRWARGQLSGRAAVGERAGAITGSAQSQIGSVWDA